MSERPSREAFAAITRKIIADHDEWDSPHHFVTLHWEDGELRCGTWAVIMPDIHPAQYPKVMAKIARECHEKDPDHPPYGYLLQFESYGVAEPGPEASDEEREQFRRDRLGRTFHQRADAVEMVGAWCADIHGRVWSAARRRGEDKIHEKFYQPGRAPGGQMIEGLLAVAYATGMTAWGLPGPQGPMN